MIFCKVFPVTCRTSFALLVAALLGFATGTSTIAHAQESSALDSLTTKSLIGEAVSLSNRDYPEIEKAIQRFRNSDSRGAFEFLKSATEKYPKLPPAEVIFARMHLVVRNAQALRVAQHWLEMAVSEHPDDPEAYLILADQAFSSGRTAESLALFEYSIPLVEKFSANNKRKGKFRIRILAGRAAVSQRRSRWEEAQQRLQEWVEADPESAIAHQRLGDVLFHLEKHSESLEEFTKAHKLDTKDVVDHPYISIGKLFSKADDIEKARKAFEQAYNEDKANEKVAQAYVDWLISQDELESAHAAVKRLREQQPDLKSGLMLDGILSVMQGNRNEAISTMTEILGVDPSNSRATDLLALLLIESEDVADQEKAMRYAQVNSQRFSDNSQVNVTQGWVLFQLGRKNEAQQYLSRVQQNTLNSDSYFLLAKMMVENNKKDQAIKTLKAIIGNESGLFIFRREAEKFLAEIEAE